MQELRRTIANTSVRWPVLSTMVNTDIYVCFFLLFVRTLTVHGAEMDERCRADERVTDVMLHARSRVCATYIICGGASIGLRIDQLGEIRLD